jgi:hypothetical protein
LPLIRKPESDTSTTSPPIAATIFTTGMTPVEQEPSERIRRRSA